MASLEIDQSELCETLAAADICTALDRDEVERLASRGTVESLRRGDLLFHAGGEADAIYLLLDGAIEIVRKTEESARPVPVAYITPGEMIGDMALLTGTPRRSDARVPQTALIWRLGRAEFEQFAVELPHYGLELARIYARRLQDLITHMRRQARRKELAGQLRYFDMPTVVQTLLSTGQSGVLTFLHDSGEVFAEVVLGKGFVDRARCRDIEGVDGFHEIFLHCDEGEFSFRSVLGFVGDAVSAVPIDVPAMHLLMESARRADEIASLRAQLDAGTREYRILAEELDAQVAAQYPLARDIHQALRTPDRLETVRSSTGGTTYDFYAAAAVMVATEIIG